jgi:hypothetical protein
MVKRHSKGALWAVGLTDAQVRTTVHGMPFVPPSFVAGADGQSGEVVF